MRFLIDKNKYLCGHFGHTDKFINVGNATYQLVTCQSIKKNLDDVWGFVF